VEENIERFGFDVGDFLKVFRNPLDQLILNLCASSGKQVDVDDRHGHLLAKLVDSAI
jgi:hypothetical protein